MMTPGSLRAEVEKERKRNREDVIRHARWEAEMVRKMGKEWFRIRDEWLIKSYEADKKMWEDPVVREALIKAVLVRDQRKRQSSEE